MCEQDWTPPIVGFCENNYEFSDSLKDGISKPVRYSRIFLFIIYSVVFYLFTSSSLNS
jgi:hypothetical protein